MIIISGTITVTPDRHDAMRAVIDDVVAPSRDEDGCLEYQFWSHLDDPGVFHVFERWESQADLDRHVTTDHYRAFARALRGLAPTNVGIDSYEVAAA